MTNDELRASPDPLHEKTLADNRDHFYGQCFAQDVLRVALETNALIYGMPMPTEEQIKRMCREDAVACGE